MAVATEIQVRDKLYIGGEWVDPTGNETIEVVNSDDGRSDRPYPAGDAGGRGQSGRSCARGVRDVVADEPDGARRLDAPDRGRACRAIRGDRGADRAGARHAAPAVGSDPGRAADDDLHLDARPARARRLGAGGRQLADRPRARRGRRRDHAVELPASPDRREGGARAGGRLHGRPEAERGRPAQRVRPRGDHGRGRPARRRLQPRDRDRSRRRRGDRLASRASTWSRSRARRARASASPSSPRSR